MKETSEGKKEGWGRERRTEKASPPKKERDHPSQQLRYSPVLQRKPITYLLHLVAGGTLWGQEGNKDYAAGTGGAGDDLPQLHGSQRCSDVL